MLVLLLRLSFFFWSIVESTPHSSSGRGQDQKKGAGRGHSAEKSASFIMRLMAINFAGHRRWSPPCLALGFSKSQKEENVGSMWESLSLRHMKNSTTRREKSIEIISIPHTHTTHFLFTNYRGRAEGVALAGMPGVLAERIPLLIAQIVGQVCQVAGFSSSWVCQFGQRPSHRCPIYAEARSCQKF